MTNDGRSCDGDVDGSGRDAREERVQRAMATDGYLVRKNIPINMIEAQGQPDWQFLIFPITAPVTVA